MPDYSYNVKIAAHSQQAADDKMRQLDPDPEVTWEYVGSEPLDSELTPLQRVLRDEGVDLQDPGDDDIEGLLSDPTLPFLAIEINLRGGSPARCLWTGDSVEDIVKANRNQEGAPDWEIETIYNLTTGQPVHYEVEETITVKVKS